MTASTDFGDYTLGQRIGKGGMAEVFLAHRKRGGADPVCVKRVLAGFLEDERFAAMFFDEARLATRLLHPNVVQVFDAGEVDGRPYLAMEYVEGPSLESLRRMLRERQELLPVEVCVDVAVQLCRALHYVHGLEVDGVSQKVVHRDVSPANVLLKRDGTVKLTDFGVARAADRVTRTQTGLTKGKCPYMSPEQARAEDVDHRTDQFAAGIVLWEMLTGQNLFDGNTAVASLEKVVGAPIPAPSSIRKSVPRAIDAVVLRALERDRDKRYADMQAFESALEQTVPPLGVDDRESRIRDELERISPASQARDAVVVPRREPRADDMEVERSLTDASLGGVFRTSPQIEERAIPLEGPVRTTRVQEEALPPRSRALRRAAIIVVVLGALAGLLAAAVRLFPEQVGELPFVARLLEVVAARSDEPSLVEPERVLPPLRSPRPPGAEEKADALEQKASEALLSGNNRRALKLLREAADLSPERASLHRKLAMAYRALDERSLAKRHLERYLALSPRASDRASVEALLEELAAAR